MSEPTGHVWQEDWEERLYERVRTLGFPTVSGYLDQKPGIPYVQIAKELGTDIAPSQVVYAQMKEGKRAGTVRDAVQDALVRCLRRGLESGWTNRPGAPSDTRSAMVYSDWCACVKSYGGMTSLDPTLYAIWKALEKLAPPQGWLPENVHDPLVQEALRVAWPMTD